MHWRITHIVLIQIGLVLIKYATRTILGMFLFVFCVIRTPTSLCEAVNFPK